MSMAGSNPSGGGGLGLVIGAAIVAVAGGVCTVAKVEPSLGTGLLAGGIAGVFIALVGKSVVSSLHDANAEAARARASQAMADGKRMADFIAQLQAATAGQLISEKAKAIAFRERDRDVVRQAMREEIAKGNWEIANNYALELERTFNDKVGADQLRAEFGQFRLAAIRQEFERVKESVSNYMGVEDWDSATRVAADFASRYPELDEGKALPKEVESRKSALREHLLARWRDAVAAKDDEAGIQLLRKLDGYLTRAEAEGMQEDARAMIAERRNKLRDQFSALVAAQKWPEAIALGQRIQTEFPNSKLALEIRANMESLKERAEGGLDPDVFSSES